MFLRKNAKQRLISLIAAASLGLSCFGITGMAAEPYEIDCSENLAASGALSLGDIGEHGSYDADDPQDDTITLEMFKSMLSAEENVNRTVICTFEIDDLIAPVKGDKATYRDTLSLKYGENAEKNIFVTQTAEYDEGSANTHTYQGITITESSTGATGTGATSSGTKYISMTYKATEDGIIAGDVYTFTFSPGSAGDAIEVVKSLGLVSVLKNANVSVVAYYANILDGSDAGSDTLTCGGRMGNYTYSTFLGFTAPENCYISKIEFHATNKFMGMDDLCLIMQEVSGDMTVPTKLELTAPDSVGTPYYGSTLEYSYSAKVFDQFGRELDEEIVIEADNTDVAELAEDGTLIIKQMTNMPDTITLTASAGGITETKEITVDKSVSPYYDATKIGVDAYTAYDEEKYGGMTVRTDYSLPEFTAAMEAAANDPDKEITMVNFGNEDEEVFVDRIRVPLLKDKDKYLDMVFPSRLIDIRYVVEDNHQLNQTTGEPYPKRFLLPPSGTHYLGIVPPVSGENEYTFEAGLLGDYRITALGFVYLGTGSNTNPVDQGFGVEVTFSDGTKKIYGTDQVKGGEGKATENTFYGIKAPAGHYITRCYITTQERSWGAVDSFGFILEEPDILTIKPDFDALHFSSFCNQNVENITENINLPTTTANGCSIDWTAKKSDNTLSDVIATDETDSANLGKVTVPDVPEKSNVRLSAAVSYGALTYVRNFDLYVPSKLERDYRKISIPEKAEADITLPTVGSEYGSTITWESLNPELIDNNGKVTLPEERGAKYCVLRATLKNASGTLVKEFGVSVEGTGEDGNSNVNSVIGSVTGNIANGNNSGLVASGGGGGGGGGGAAKQPVPVEVKPSVDETQPAGNTSFADVSEEHWAYDSIEALTEKGILNGVGNGRFNPEGTVTREQYLSMLVRAFNFTAENASADFTDVEKNSWYFDSVSVAQSLGICGGYEDGSFGIGKEITREEMAVMAYRCALLAELGIESTEESPLWKDSGEISHFAYDAVAALNSAGIIKGISEDEFSPKTTTTRAQAAVIIQRLLSVE